MTRSFLFTGSPTVMTFTDPLLFALHTKDSGARETLAPSLKLAFPDNPTPPTVP